MSDRDGNGPVANLLCGSARQCLTPARLREGQYAPDSTHVLRQAVGGHPPELPDPSPVKVSVDRVGSVLNEQADVSLTALLQPLHPVRDTVEVGRQDRLQPTPGRGVDGGGVDVSGARIHRTEDWNEARRQDREEDHIVVHRGHEHAIPRPKPFAKGEVESQTARREIHRLAPVSASEKVFDGSHLVAHSPALPDVTHGSQAALVLTSLARRAATLRGSSIQSSATSAVSLPKSRLKSEIPPSGSPEAAVPAVTPPKSNHFAPARFAHTIRSHISGYPMCRRPRSLGRDEPPAK